MPLDPEIRRILKESGGIRIPLRTPSPAKRRRDGEAAAEAGFERLGLAIPDVRIDRVTVPVTGAPDVDIRIHRPHGDEGLLPTVISFFGGAFRQGSNDFSMNRWMHAQRAIDAGAAVIAVDYAQAPEHRFPAALEQGFAVLDWVQTHGAGYGADPARLAVGGQSSGGNLAAALVQQNQVRDRHPVRLQLLEVPVLDLTGGHMDLRPARELHVPAFLVRRDRRGILRDYLGKHGDATDPRVSPLLREDLTGLPPAVILAAEYDPLRGDAAAYHARLRDAGVPSSATIALGQTHDSGGMVGLLRAADVWHATVVGALRALHEPAVGVA